MIMAKGGVVWPKPAELGIGTVTNFFDTLGIGSYAPTTAVWKATKIVDDRLIPGSLTIGHTPPTIAQAFIFIAIVTVDFTTLVALLAAAVAGAWLGAGVVSGWSKRNVQLGMGVTLLIAASLFIFRNLDEMRGTPMIPGGMAEGLTGGLLIAGLVGNFILGALMTLGVGLYAPCLIMISLLGMNPTTAFPIMMGSCAFLMPIAGARFLEKGSYALRPSLGLTLGGVPAVLVAALLVKSLPLTAVRWLVVIVVLYTSVSMLRSYRASANEPSA
ncbi:MAG: permease [Gemmatimonadetes bacterium]|nr:permease [Gemmatimonadota bacterium]